MDSVVDPLQLRILLPTMGSGGAALLAFDLPLDRRVDGDRDGGGE